MAWDTTADRALMLGEFSGDGELTYSQRAASGTSPQITCKTGETSVLKSVPLENADGTARDLTDWGDLRLTIERPLVHTDVQVVENADITISGDDNEVFTFQPSSTVLAQPGDFVWSLREASTGEEIVSGMLTVTYSPIKDVAP